MNLEFINPIHWKKSVLVGLLAAFIFTWYGFMDSYSLSTRYELSNKKADLENKIQELTVSTEELKTKISKLDGDVLLLEKIAREEYGMRKPGETVYKIKRVD